MLYINDLSKLKITKVNIWKIYFDYADKHYMLIDDSDEDAHISLYERIIDSNGKVELEFITGQILCGWVMQYIRNISTTKRPKTLVYSLIDRMYFVKRITLAGLADSVYKDEIEQKQLKLDEYEAEIKRLQKLISDTKIDMLKSDGHGSKTTSKQYELKLKASERIKGKQAGEYCEEYQAYYGDIHPEYGGQLVDLFALPVGMYFRVTNGQYDATILVDEHGDKCIVTLNSCVKLTKEKHSAYIE